MSDSISLPNGQYLSPPPPYYSTPHLPHNSHGHSVSAPQRQESQRKRPKYTRSKTGCMTCRVKKIKCDEAKPNCMRCTHGQRDCTWPDSGPARKKVSIKKESSDGRPSTAGSSPESSTPPTRDNSPHRRMPMDIGLPPLASRRQSSDPYLQLHPLPPPSESNRHSMERGYPHHHHNSYHHSQPPSPPDSLVLPEVSYPQNRHQQHYDYSNNSHSRSRNMPAQSSVNQWAPPPLMTPEPYPHYDNHGRSLMAHSSSNDHHHHHRYQ
ncbi:hypothetical protein C8J56DRAFT_1022830 [Mycena floridula]|nr:hypothetical protein C8J56DRAFT_1022830 [Mycena floridula]